MKDLKEGQASYGRRSCTILPGDDSVFVPQDLLEDRVEIQKTALVWGGEQRG